MLNFQIQTDSDVPASKQLFAQIQFAIASGQYPAGHRLPSTRQLAMITGLHRNTISKVYQNLEEKGLVESVAGSGIYVKNPELGTQKNSPSVAHRHVIQEAIDSLVEQGCSLKEIRKLFVTEIDWRLRCKEQVIVTVPSRDLSAGEIMHQELMASLKISVELVVLEKLPALLEKNNFGTLITNRYFLKEVLEIIPANSFRIIPIDIYDYSKELAIIKKLPSQARLGIVSLSEETLKVAESIVRSQRGEDLLVLTAPQRDRSKLMTLIRNAHTIIAGPSSYKSVQEAIADAKADLIRLPEVICSDKYINPKSISLLKKELLQ